VSRVDLDVDVGPLSLASPILTASGTFGHGDEVARLGAPTRLGAVTAKSVSPEPWAGNPAPRLHMTASGMVNAVGLQGPGMAAWLAHDLPALRATGARVIASVWGHTVDDFARATEMLEGADVVAVEINASCPNLHASDPRGAIWAHDARAIGDVVRAVREATQLPVLAKLSPNVTDLTEIARAAVAAGADALTLVNTVLALVIDAETRRPALGAGGGGLSGPAVKPIALRAVRTVTRALPHVPVIGTGGVQSGVDAVEMLLAGASAVAVGTANFRDPRAPYRVLDELVDWCTRHDVARVRDLTGTLEDA